MTAGPARGSTADCLDTQRQNELFEGCASGGLNTTAVRITPISILLRNSSDFTIQFVLWVCVRMWAVSLGMEVCVRVVCIRVPLVFSQQQLLTFPYFLLD